jgi:hypothetical protein
VKALALGKPTGDIMVWVDLAQGRSDADPLSLTPGKFVGIFIQIAPPKPDFFQKLFAHDVSPG